MLPAFAPAVVAQTTPQKIKAIQAAYTSIENSNTLKQVTLSGEEFSEHACDNGCTLTGYFKGDSIKKMSDWIGLSYGIIERSFYFKAGRLVFVYESERHFVHDSTGAPVYNKPPIVVFEGRYYFEGNTLIKDITKGKKFGGEKENPGSLLKLAKDYTALLKGNKDN
jgi:hypothetical protein